VGSQIWAQLPLLRQCVGIGQVQLISRPQLLTAVPLQRRTLAQTTAAGFG
jgi:hypothetical protein